MSRVQLHFKFSLSDLIRLLFVLEAPDMYTAVYLGAQSFHVGPGPPAGVRADPKRLIVLLG